MTRLFLLLSFALLSGYLSVAQVRPDTLSTKIDALFNELNGPGRPGGQQGTFLELVHVHHDNVLLKLDGKDKFSSNWWFTSSLESVRDAKNAVVGLRVSNGRVRNLWFKRLPDDFDAGKVPVSNKEVSFLL